MPIVFSESIFQLCKEVYYVSDRRKPFKTVQSKGITLPASMQISDEGISMAASDRLILMDTIGEVPEANLLKFFMHYVDQPFQNYGSS